MLRLAAAFLAFCCASIPALSLDKKDYLVSNIAILPFIDNTSTGAGEAAQAAVEGVLKTKIRRFSLTPSFKMNTIISENNIFGGGDKTINIKALQKVAGEFGIDLFILGNVIEVEENLKIVVRYVFGRTLEELKGNTISIGKDYDQETLNSSIEEGVRAFMAQIPYHGVIYNAANQGNISIKFGKSWQITPGTALDVIEITKVTKHAFHKYISAFETRQVTTLNVMSVKGDYVYASNNDPLTVEKGDFVLIQNPVESGDGGAGAAMDAPQQQNDAPNDLFAPPTSEDDLLAKPRSKTKPKNQLLDPESEESPSGFGEEPPPDEQPSESLESVDRSFDKPLSSTLDDEETEKPGSSKGKKSSGNRTYSIAPLLGASFYSYTLNDGVAATPPATPFSFPVSLNGIMIFGLAGYADIADFLAFEGQLRLGTISSNVQVNQGGTPMSVKTSVGLTSTDLGLLAKYAFGKTDTSPVAGLRIHYRRNVLKPGKVALELAGKSEPVYIIPMTVAAPTVGLYGKFPLTPEFILSAYADYWIAASLAETPAGTTGQKPAVTAFDFSLGGVYRMSDLMGVGLTYEGLMLSTQFADKGRLFQQDLTNAKTSEMYNTVLLSLQFFL